MRTQKFQQLIAWQKAVDLVERIYKLTARFPREEIYTLTSQIRRAAVSIPTNIAEGHGRRGDPEFMRFLLIAHGSTSELESHLIVAERLAFITGRTLTQATDAIHEVGRLINGLHRSLSRETRPRASYRKRLPDSDDY